MRAPNRNGQMTDPQHAWTFLSLQAQAGQFAAPQAGMMMQLLLAHPDCDWSSDHLAGQSPLQLKLQRAGDLLAENCLSGEVY